MKKNEVVVTALDKRYKTLEKDLAETAKKILIFLKQEGVKIEIYLVGTAKIKTLNRRYRGKNEPTNVLTFELPGSFPQLESPYLSLGEIYLCPPYIKRRSEDISFLVAHCLLHLIGFKHGEESDRMAMARVETQLRQWLDH